MCERCHGPNNYSDPDKKILVIPYVGFEKSTGMHFTVWRRHLGQLSKSFILASSYSVLDEHETAQTRVFDLHRDMKLNLHTSVWTDEANADFIKS